MKNTPICYKLIVVAKILIKICQAIENYYLFVLSLQSLLDKKKGKVRIICYNANFKQ